MITVAWHFGVILGCWAAFLAYTQRGFSVDVPDVWHIGDVLFGYFALGLGVFLLGMMLLGMW